MKILIINENRHNSIGGIEKYTSLIADIFNENNHEVYEYAFNLNPERIDMFDQNPNITPLNIVTKTEKGISIAKRRKIIKDCVREIEQIHNDFDLVINQTANIKWPKEIYNSSKWLYVQHFNPNFYKQRYIAGLFLQPLIYFGMWLVGIKNPFKKFSNFVVYSSEDKNKLKISKAKKVWEVPLAVYSKKQIKSFSQMHNKKEGLIFFGRLDKKQKKIKQMIKFCKNNNLKLDIYGEGHFKFKTSKDISYKGAFDKKDISKILTEYKYSILLSKYEGFSFSVVESLSHGIPVIINNFCPSAKNLSNNKGYFKLPLKNIVLNESLYKKQVEECIKFSIDNLSIEAFNNMWKKIINYFNGV